MAITVDWPQRIINIPRDDLLLVQSSPTEIRQLDLDTFRLELRGLEDDAEGMGYVATHNHVQPITVGGVTLARVVEIINNYTVTFENGQYAVNLVGANSNVGDVVNVNQVSVRSANSAGLTFSDQINEQSFQGAVWIDPESGSSGTSFPRGTPTDPVDNWLDATTIANSLGFLQFQLRNTLVLPAEQNVDGYAIHGVNPLSSIMVFQGGSGVNTSLDNVSFAGALGDGYKVARSCIVGDITNVEGAFVECVLNGNVTLDATPSMVADVSFMNCVSGFPGNVTFTLDCNNTTADIQFRNWSGGMVVENFTTGNAMSVDVAQGKITLDSTCTAGTILIRGIAEVVDNSGAGCNVITTGTIRSDMAIQEARIIGAMP